MLGRRHRNSTWFIALALWAEAAVAFAQVKEVKSFRREMDVGRTEGLLTVTTEFPEIFTKRLRHRLSSGFKSRFVVDVALEDRGRRLAVAGEVMHYTILYKIWDEHFLVRKEGLIGRKDLKLRSMNELIENCGKIVKLPLGGTDGVASNSKYRIRVRITVNPVSKELRRKVRQYLANPDGGSRRGDRRSFFGAFSRIFVNEKDFRADAVYTYLSPEFKLPAE